MALKVPALTQSAVLREVQHEDNTLHIVGFVDSIMGQQAVGRNRSFSLFKFVITNGDLKVEVLVWEDQIPAVAVDLRFNKIDEDFVDYDLSIQRATKLIFHGPLNVVDRPAPKLAEKVQIKHAAAYQGVRTVEGYLCVPFVRMTTGQGTCSFGSSAVSDGAYKLRLQVANHVDVPTFVPGCPVSITGLIKKSEKSESLFMQLEHMSEIKKIDDKTLSVEELANCFRRPLTEVPGDIHSVNEIESETDSL